MRGWLSVLLVWVAAGPAFGLEKVYEADGFVDSIGVNVHLAYTDTPYYTAFEEVRASLHQLGVRYVRDNVVGIPHLYRSDDIPSRWRALGRDGVRTLLVSNMAIAATEVAAYARMASTSIEAIEGPNKYDLVGDPEWIGRLQRYQTDLAAAIEPLDLPVVMPSLGRPQHALLIATLRAQAHYANIHSYPGGRTPMTDFVRHRAAAQAVLPGRPLIATETGYHNAVHGRGDHPAVSGDAAAIYIQRLLLAYFAAGVYRTYLYQLHDQNDDPRLVNREAYFGLLDYHFRPKPAAAAMLRLMALLGDPGPRFRPKFLDLFVAGDRRDLKQVHFQKRDGRHFVALWREVAVYDPTQQRPLKVPARHIVLRFSHEVAVALYQPNHSERPVRSQSRVRRLALDVGAEVLILEIVQLEKSA